jgi:hypothetical protein
MAEEDTGSKNRSLTLPVGALGAALALGLAAAAYNYMSSSESSDSAPSKSKSGSMRKKVGLMTLITLLENDATRKVVLSVLRAIAKRA